MFLAKLARAFHRAALAFVKGMASPAPPAPSPVQETILSQPIVVSEIFFQLFKGHGIDCQQEADWIVFPNRSIRASAVIVKEWKPKASYTAQLDFRMELNSGQRLIESCGGLGETRENAIKNAIENFVLNSFHVILAAFFGPQGDQVTVEEWRIGSEDRRVIIGPMGMRGKLPDPSNPPLAWLKEVYEKVRSKALPGGTHWLRVYYGQYDNRAEELEVLLDNDDWAEVRNELATIDWPKGKEFFSLRVFMIIQDK
jgi:hypothetical protein